LLDLLEGKRAVVLGAPPAFFQVIPQLGMEGGIVFLPTHVTEVHIGRRGTGIGPDGYSLPPESLREDWG